MALVLEYVSGSVFGAALFASGVYSPHVIQGQMSLSSFHMAKTMLAANATSALIIHAADRAGIATSKVKPPSRLRLFAFDGNILGGALLGLGMALCGACPGTSLVQAAVGSRTGCLVVGGGVLGSLLYPRLISAIQSTSVSRSPDSAHGSQAPSMSHTLGISNGSLLVGWQLLCLSMLGLLMRFQPDAPGSKFLVDPITGGLLVGFAQAASVGLTRHAIGVSGAYADLSRWLEHLVGHAEKSATLLTPSLVFASGIASAAALLAYLTRGTAAAPTQVSDGLAVVGGAVLVLGARLAGGCTSGHGISGMASFAWASLITVAAMMGSGIACTVLGSALRG